MRTPVAVLLFIAALAWATHARGADAEASAVAGKVLQNKEWIADTLVCPATVVPPPDAALGVAKNKCTPGKLGTCLNKCGAGNASACYWLALALLQDDIDRQAPDALYQRSCKLGIMSGCTNRGAGLLRRGPKGVATHQCAAQTFSKACDGNDPWACTMFASLLNKGEGVAKNDDLALKVMEKSCKYGPTDDACSNAMELRASILKARSGTGAK